MGLTADVGALFVDAGMSRLRGERTEDPYLSGGTVGDSCCLSGPALNVTKTPI
jgi:hypothetical protein